MKIFIAGATGAIGVPLVQKLLAGDHLVFAMTRSQEKAQALSKKGVTAVFADALDAEMVMKGVMNFRPDVIVNMLTSLPKRYTPEAMSNSSMQNAQVRLQGGANLLAAAKKAGVQRYIVQSAAFWYAPGKGLATEEDSFAFEAPPAIAKGTRVYAELEQAAFENPNLEGVSLRFGFFYGPGTWFHPDGDMADQVRACQVPIIGEGSGIWNWVHIDDAADAIIASLKSPPGIYNITDDKPVEMRIWLPAFAHFLGAPFPPRFSLEEGMKEKGPDSIYYATKLRGASNLKAKRLLAFKPRPLAWIS